jgi:hypothetical protein
MYLGIPTATKLPTEDGRMNTTIRKYAKSNFTLDFFGV